MPYHRISIQRLERHRHHDGSTVNFTVPGVDRRHLSYSLSPDEVPAFDGDVGYFECMWHRKGPWMGWTVVRQVEPEAYQAAQDDQRSRFRYCGKVVP